MKLVSLFFLILLTSCAGTTPKRTPSAESFMRLGVVDLPKSRARLFPADKPGVYNFYLELRDAAGDYVDCDQSEVEVLTRKKVGLPFAFERLLVGRYYLTIDEEAVGPVGLVEIAVRGERLPDKFKLIPQKPDAKFSKITLIENERNIMRLRLRIADAQNQTLDLQDRPEILFHGEGDVSELEEKGNGVWEFSVIYPEVNQIMYFSIRAQGTYIHRIFRYHHIEK